MLARTYLEHLDPALPPLLLREQAGPQRRRPRLSTSTSSCSKVNSDLVGKVVNLAQPHRALRRRTRAFAALPRRRGPVRSRRRCAARRSRRPTRRATTRARCALVMALADRANEYVDRASRGSSPKQPERAGELADVCTVVLNLYRQIVVYLAPVLPRLAAQTGELFGAPIASWQDAKSRWSARRSGEFRHLMQRVDPKKIEAVIAASLDASADVARRRLADAQRRRRRRALAEEPLAAECTIDDFREGRSARRARGRGRRRAGAKKLLKLTVSLGGGMTRTVFAGIKAAYEPRRWSVGW